MAKNTQLATLAVNAQADALGALLNYGWIDFMDGAQPANADMSTIGRRVLASCRFAAAAFKPAVNGEITANAIAPDDDAKATTQTGATWAICYKADHKTPVMHVSVGVKDANIIMASVMIQQHTRVRVDAFTHTVSRATPGQ